MEQKSPYPGGVNDASLTMKFNASEDFLVLGQHIRNYVRDPDYASTLGFQIPPEVWCFRYVFGVQIPPHKVFGSLGQRTLSLLLLEPDSSLLLVSQKCAKIELATTPRTGRTGFH